MKITRLRRLPLSIPLPRPIPSAKTIIKSIDCLAVFLDTDEGLAGEGLVFTLNGLRLPVLDQMIASFEPLVVGTDPGMGGAFVSRAWADTAFLGRPGVTAVGLAAIDMALWDLRGKAAGMNVSRMLGAYRDALPVYRSNGLRLSAGIDQIQAEAEAFIEQGFRAIKMSLGMPSMDDDVARVRAVREAIGPDIMLMADCNQQFTAPQAIRLGRRLEEYGLAWIEEPVPSRDHAAEAAVAAALDTPIASGENEYTSAGMFDMLRQGSADILMPDMQRMGGPTEVVKAVLLAEAFKVPVSPHLFSEMTLSLAAGLPNVMIVEYVAWFENLYSSRVELDGEGRAKVPAGPGWGMTFDPDALARFAV
ncbi:mandelate racemase/muconate lactonizing enzyme family protein [Pigmentiphaga soli]